MPWILTIKLQQCVFNGPFLITSDDVAVDLTAWPRIRFQPLAPLSNWMWNLRRRSDQKKIQKTNCMSFLSRSKRNVPLMRIMNSFGHIFFVFLLCPELKPDLFLSTSGCPALQVLEDGIPCAFVSVYIIFSNRNCGVTKMDRYDLENIYINWVVWHCLIEAHWLLIPLHVCHNQALTNLARPYWVS